MKISKNYRAISALDFRDANAKAVTRALHAGFAGMHPRNDDLRKQTCRVHWDVALRDGKLIHTVPLPGFRRQQIGDMPAWNYGHEWRVPTPT